MNSPPLDVELLTIVASEYRRFTAEQPKAEAYKLNTLSHLNEQWTVDALEPDNMEALADSLRKSNPTSSSFVHWREPVGFAAYVAKDPREAAELVRNLFAPGSRPCPGASPTCGPARGAAWRASSAAPPSSATS